MWVEFANFLSETPGTTRFCAGVSVGCQASMSTVLHQFSQKGGRR